MRGFMKAVNSLLSISSLKRWRKLNGKTPFTVKEALEIDHNSKGEYSFFSVILEKDDQIYALDSLMKVFMLSVANQSFPKEELDLAIAKVLKSYDPKKVMAICKATPDARLLTKLEKL